VSVQWTGLQEFKNELRRLPEHLQDEAARIVVAAASQAKNEAQANYPTGPTGNLKRGVGMTVESASRLGASATVRSRAYHAHLYEGGYTRAGKGTAKKEVQSAIPIFIRARRRMVEALIKLVQSTGLTVSP
jgi:hypothetical protein